MELINKKSLLLFLIYQIPQLFLFSPFKRVMTVPLKNQATSIEEEL